MVVMKMMSTFSKPRFPVVLSLLFSFTFMLAFLSGFGVNGVEPTGSSNTFPQEGRKHTFSSPHRKPLEHSLAIKEPNKIGEKCSKADIVISQGPTAPLPTGIPTYTVEISNMCVTGCDISNIHVACGWFSSARLINPKVFRRLSYNDCLVNDGKPLINGGTISFQYATTFPYPLSVSSVHC